MTELDHVWSNMLAEAGQKASDTGRHDIAEYLRLKATNDAIRNVGVAWLFDTIIEIAGRAMSERPGLTIEREEPYTFTNGNSTMVGSLIQIRHGVRCMSVEAGWARMPGDGIMRSGALAFARISHFGLPKFTVEMSLVHTENTPVWRINESKVVDTVILTAHLDKLFAD